MRDLWACLDFSAFACEVASASCTVATVSCLNHFLRFGRKSTIADAAEIECAKLHVILRCAVCQYDNTFRLDSELNNHSESYTVGLLCFHTAPANTVCVQTLCKCHCINAFTEKCARKIVWYFVVCKLNNFSLPSKPEMFYITVEILIFLVLCEWRKFLNIEFTLFNVFSPQIANINNTLAITDLSICINLG